MLHNVNSWCSTLKCHKILNEHDGCILADCHEILFQLTPIYIWLDCTQCLRVGEVAASSRRTTCRAKTLRQIQLWTPTQLYTGLTVLETAVPWLLCKDRNTMPVCRKLLDLMLESSGMCLGERKSWSEIPTRIEAKNDYAGEGQQQFNRFTDLLGSKVTIFGSYRRFGGIRCLHLQSTIYLVVHIYHTTRCNILSREHRLFHTITCCFPKRHWKC